jgi:hypothetical protein
MGSLTGSVPFLHSEFFRPSEGGLRLELMAYYQSQVSNKRRLKGLLGGTCRMLWKGSAWVFLDLLGGFLGQLAWQRRGTGFQTL